MDTYCSNSKYVQDGLTQYLNCVKSGTYCKYQKYCSKKNKVVQGDNYLLCPILHEKEERTMVAKATNSKASTKNNEDILSSKDTVKSSDIIAEEPEKATVLLVFDDYIIADKDGANIKIIGKFNYKRGDIINL